MSSPKPKRYLLREDKLSTYKRGKIYARGGEVVTEVADHGEVLIVSGSKESFSVSREEVIQIGK